MNFSYFLYPYCVDRFFLTFYWRGREGKGKGSWGILIIIIFFKIFFKHFFCSSFSSLHIFIIMRNLFLILVSYLFGSVFVVYFFFQIKKFSTSL